MPSRWQRLTPMAGALVGVIVFAMIAAVVAVGSVLADRHASSADAGAGPATDRTSRDAYAGAAGSNTPGSSSSGSTPPTPLISSTRSAAPAPSAGASRWVPATATPSRTTAKPQPSSMPSPGDLTVGFASGCEWMTGVRSDIGYYYRIRLTVRLGWTGSTGYPANVLSAAMTATASTVVSETLGVTASGSLTVVFTASSGVAAIFGKGPVPLTLVIDSAGTVREKNEANNRKDVVVTFPATAPDVAAGYQPISCR